MLGSLNAELVVKICVGSIVEDAQIVSVCESLNITSGVIAETIPWVVVTM